MAAAAETQACRWCGNVHGLRCPWVKAFEFDPPGSDVVRRVEFLTPNDCGPPPRTSDDVPQEDYPRLGST